MKLLIPFLLAVNLSSAASVTDDLGNEVILENPPQRIVSLAPHLTELVFSLGAGDRIVATVRHSDHPPEAKDIPRLGDAFSLSVEAVVALSPDLILAWSTGGNQRTLSQLRELGYSIYLNEAATLEDIGHSARKLGMLIGRAEEGRQLADDFLGELENIRAGGATEPVSVFFQVSDEQLYTFNDDHLIGQAINACGADNVFGSLELPVPMVSLESVLDVDPDVILVARPYEGFKTRWSKEWQRLGWQGRVRYINASLITRPGLRMLEGIKSMCKSVMWP